MRTIASRYLGAPGAAISDLAFNAIGGAIES